jgi:hypothetical protein
MRWFEAVAKKLPWSRQQAQREVLTAMNAWEELALGNDTDRWKGIRLVTVTYEVFLLLTDQALREKTYGGVGVWIHVFLTSALVGGE